jgi:hypothetical protein
MCILYIRTPIVKRFVMMAGGWRRHRFGMFALRGLGHAIHLEKAATSVGTGGEVEPVEMPLLGHPQILSHLEYGAPQTSNYDVCATHANHVSDPRCGPRVLD